jgi:hypothetical protein
MCRFLTFEGSADEAFLQGIVGELPPSRSALHMVSDYRTRAQA